MVVYSLGVVVEKKAKGSGAGYHSRLTHIYSFCDTLIHEVPPFFPTHSIREIPDHATIREKENTLGWLDKLGEFLSLTGAM